MLTALIAAGLLTLAAASSGPIIHLIRRVRHYHRLKPISETEAKTNSKPLTNAIITLSTTNPPQTEEPTWQDSNSTTSPSPETSSATPSYAPPPPEPPSATSA